MIEELTTAPQSYLSATVYTLALLLLPIVHRRLGGDHV